MADINELQDKFYTLVQQVEPEDFTELEEFVKSDQSPRQELIEDLENDLAPIVINCSILGLRLEDLMNSIIGIAEKELAENAKKLS